MADVSPSALCSRCITLLNHSSLEIAIPNFKLDILQKPPLFEPREEKIVSAYVHHEFFSGFEQAAERGCHLCLLFHDMLSEERRLLLRTDTGRFGTHMKVTEPSSPLGDSHVYNLELLFGFMSGAGAGAINTIRLELGLSVLGGG